MKLEVQNGCFTYPKSSRPVLTDVNFGIEDGVVMTILGRNGIGKTTLIRCMSGILKWSSGSVLVDGIPMNSVHKVDDIAFVPQAHKLSYGYSVEDMVLMGRVRHMGMLSIPSKHDREIARNVIEQMGLQDLSQRDCTQLSGGQLQMAFIARALAANPKVLVMDEPESHLDFKNQYFILNLIERLVRDRGLSCIINTHYPDHALRISDKTLLMGDNCSVFGDTLALLTEKNVHKFFDVRAHIADVEIGSEYYKTFIVLGT